MLNFSLSRTLVGVCALFSCFSVSGQEVISLPTLQEVEISAPKYPQKLSRSGKVVTVISNEQIQMALGKNLGELLQEQAGISIVGSRSAAGTNQEVYVRGANTGHVLVLMDGFPLNDPSHISQVWDWNLVSLSSLERIEILKGGQSTLYGSDAMAAVINLVSKKMDVEHLQTHLNLQAGGFGTYSPQVQLLGKFKKIQWKVLAKDYISNGFSAAEVKGGENDGFRQQNVDLQLSSPIGKKSWLDLTYQVQNYRGNLDAGPFTDELDYTSKVNSSSFRFQFQHKLAHADIYLRGFTDVIHRIFKNDSTYVSKDAFSSYYESHYQGFSKGVELYSKISVGTHSVLILGGEWRNQSTQQTDFSISSYGRYDSPEINESLANQSILAFYATFQQNWTERIGLELGSRWNQQSTFGNFTTLNINPYWMPHKKLKIFANVSTGFKVPSLYQLFSPYGNVALVPEKGATYEMGWENRFSFWKYRIVLFENQVKDGIVFQSMDTDPYGKYVNVSKQNTQGIEAEISFQSTKWSSQMNYTYLTGTVSSNIGGKDSTYSSLIRRPKNTITWNVTYAFHEKWKLSMMNQWLDSRTDYVYDEQVYTVVAKQLEAYYWMDLQAFYQASKNVQIGVVLKNVWNQKIAELYGYNGQMRNTQVNLSIRF